MKSACSAASSLNLFGLVLLIVGAAAEGGDEKEVMVEKKKPNIFIQKISTAKQNQG